MHIVFASDQGYVRQLTASSGSAVYASRGSSERLVVHVLDCGIVDESWVEYEATLRRVATRIGLELEVKRHIIDMNLFANFKSWTNGSKAVWARLLIPTLLPDVDRCVYSDCDMLFIANPIEILDSLKEPNAYLAGHLDFSCTRHQEATLWREKGFSFDAEKYICSGLIALNLAAFRTENLVQKSFDFIESNPDIKYVDQTTLNLVCLGHTVLLPDEWGVFSTDAYTYTGSIKALHLAGCLRWPWEICKTWQQVMWLYLSREEFAIWLEFEKRILDASSSATLKPSLRLHLIAAVVLFLGRMGNLIGVKIGRGRLQKLVAAHDHLSSAIENMRQEIFKGG